MVEPIIAPHHVIPGSPPAPTTTPMPPTASGHAGHAAVATAAETIAHHHVVHASAQGLFGLLGAVGAALAVLALAALFLRIASPRPLRASSGEGGGGWGLGGPYRYGGLKAVLRRVFLEWRERASRILGASLEAKTAREIASMLGVGAAARFAAGYEPLVYGKREPREADVDVLRRLAEESLGEAGSRGEA
ncbi:MAG: hypothetical protein GSR80_000362 [Desulfurococcales archaeon]|nr:hypothetical protein [Desulfurococcales archaeon]